ncbi:MAG: hypothetical protein SV765_11875 [Pseudomonadota bacterium]|nr:hypothetical protein [Pseudomonadota bacterium]
MRFTVKQTLQRLLPFRKGGSKGVDLVPALVECGPDLCHYLELDAADLNRIVNFGLQSEEAAVDQEDLEILVAAGATPPYIRHRIANKRQGGLAELDRQPVKQHFFDKYLFPAREKRGQCGNDQRSESEGTENKETLNTMGATKYVIQ